MGLKLDAHVELTDKLAYHAADIGTIDDALAAARKTRAELKAQKERQEYARLTYGAAKAERLPTLGASADYGGIGGTPSAALATYSYGVSVRLPIFDGGRREAHRSESLSQYRQEQTRGRDLQDQVDLEVRLAFDSINSAAAQVLAAQEGVGLSENELAQARRRYQAGVANSIEVTDAQTRLDRARDNLIAALYNYNLARIDLATATGNIREFVNQ
jgi:outer membrane protein TolC